MASEPVAYLNHGRWVVDCPGCSNAFLVDQIPIQCPSCGTEILKAQLPSNKERAAVESTVASRPEANRNWDPGEPIDLLIADNIAHGVGNS